MRRPPNGIQGHSIIITSSEIQSYNFYAIEFLPELSFFLLAHRDQYQSLMQLNSDIPRISDMIVVLKEKFCSELLWEQILLPEAALVKYRREVRKIK